jgi:hypothetical protein
VRGDCVNNAKFLVLSSRCLCAGTGFFAWHTFIALFVCAGRVCQGVRGRKFLDQGRAYDSRRTGYKDHDLRLVALIHELPRASLLGNPLAGYREVMRPYTKNVAFSPIDIRRFHHMLWLRIDIRDRGYLSPGPVRLPILRIKNSSFALYTRCRRSAYSVFACKQKSGRARGVMYQMRPDGVARPLFYKEGPTSKRRSQGLPC